MARPAAQRSWLRAATPLQAHPVRAVAEGAAGCAVFLLAAVVVSPFHEVGNVVSPFHEADALAVALDIFAWLWLVVWPAWRLRPVRAGRWWRRMGAGVVRALLTSAFVALAGTALVALLWPSVAEVLLRGGMVALALGFLLSRLVVTLGAVIGRRVRRRLRWQLMASHVGVILLLIVTLTAVGSVVGLTAALMGVQPDPTVMAQGVADDLRLTNSIAPLNRQRVNEVFGEIENARLPLRGEPALVGLAPRPLLPNPIALLSPDGRVLAGLQEKDQALLARLWSDLPSVTPARWRRLQYLALSGRAGVVSVAREPGVDSPLALAEAPVRGPDGRIRALVLLRVPSFAPTTTQYLQGTLALFGVATVAVILVTSLPVLGLSFLFSYLMARGLTRRLESVSTVATAIASGDLSQRAPVTTRNEVGLLARNVNRMAAHLETTMAELQQARTQAEEALRTRQELVANISHELRTPLAVVRAHLETLMMRAPVTTGPVGAPEETEITVPAATLQALQNETERLESLVEDLFGLSRAQAGAVEVRCEPVDVAGLVDEVAALMRPLAQRDGMIALSVESPPGLSYALADADRLRQIIANLVRNAVRHTPEGGIIVLSVAADGPWVVVSVADTGEGIPAEHLPYIFERLYRVDQARSRSSGGAGLGLAIVRELVELMGGRVTVESKRGEGSCFRVFLPAASRPRQG